MLSDISEYGEGNTNDFVGYGTEGLNDQKQEQNVKIKNNFHLETESSYI